LLPISFERAEGAVCAIVLLGRKHLPSLFHATKHARTEKSLTALPSGQL
jgi:hypothetical protein